MGEHWFWFVVGALVGMLSGSILAGLIAAQFVKVTRDEVYDQGYQHGVAQGETRERVARHLVFHGINVANIEADE